MENLSLKNYKKEITKADIQKQVDGVVSQIKNGDADALEMFVKLKAMKTAIDSVMKEIQTDVIDEHAKHGIKQVIEHGVEVSVVSSTKPKLNYDQDPETVKLTEKLKDRKKVIDDAFNMWKKDHDAELVVNGEIVPVVDVKSYTADSIKCSFKK